MTAVTTDMRRGGPGIFGDVDGKGGWWLLTSFLVFFLFQPNLTKCNAYLPGSRVVDVGNAKVNNQVKNRYCSLDHLRRWILITTRPVPVKPIISSVAKKEH